MDYIINMYVKDNSDKYESTDPLIITGSHPTQIELGWSDKLCGKSLQEFERNPVIFLIKNYNYRLRK